MYTVDKHTLKFIATYILAITLGGVAGGLLSSCSDETIETGANVDNDGKGTGEMVMFSVGTTDNAITRASEAKTYYMPNASRFVCRMYYKAQTGSEEFDTLGTDQTVWMKVKGNIGNSLYWNRDYTEVPENIKGKGGVDDYGNDYSAHALYWQNRKEHAFLAWTDLNHATTIKGGPTQGQLKFNADDVYKVYTNQTVSKWVTKYYKIYGIDEEFATQADMQAYMQRTVGEKTYGETDEFRNIQKQLQYVWTSTDAMNSYRYEHGWQHKTSSHYAKITYDTGDEQTATKYENGWVQYLMYFDRIPYTKLLSGDEIEIKDPKDDNIITFLKDKETGKYICAAEVKKDPAGNFLDKDGHTTDNPAQYAYNYYVTDEDGNLKYDEEKPRYTFYYKQYAEKEDAKEVFEYPAVTFDMKRTPEMESMADQADIVQALAVQAPTGATQESNRVNLYFKHQFSQLQVNLKNAADNSVVLEASDIQKVELLGVTEKSYVFTDLDADGKVRATAYEDIDFSKYNENQLKENQFGTSLQMFEMPEADTEYGYLKSFNAIAFGQLQAIRITWKEKDTEYVHAATYRIPSNELVNLKSGVRYVWNIEIRRGTLAIIRTEIVDWELPNDEPHNGSTDGTIQN